jgi:uncharacterized protein YbjQ (UPF0145 family)
VSRDSCDGFDTSWITTAPSFDGFMSSEGLGVVRGITVRSKGNFGMMVAGWEMVFGGRIRTYMKMCERARQEAFEAMARHAAALGAHAVIGMRYDTAEIVPGVTEVLCYGTAVKLAKRAS